jgi:hypothetical protein
MCCAVLYAMSGWKSSPFSGGSEKAISDVFSGHDGQGWPPGWCVAVTGVLENHLRGCFRVFTSVATTWRVTGL